MPPRETFSRKSVRLLSSFGESKDSKGQAQRRDGDLKVGSWTVSHEDKDCLCSNAVLVYHSQSLAGGPAAVKFRSPREEGSPGDRPDLSFTQCQLSQYFVQSQPYPVANWVRSNA